MKKNVFKSFLPALFLLMFMTGVFTSCPQPEKPSPTYTITCASIIGGTVTASATTATVGTEVLLIALAETGYRLETYTVVGVNGNVNVTGNKFIMPAENVVVTATFTAINYTINIGSINNGTVTASRTTATAGTEITLSNTADNGYVFGSYTVTKAGGGTVTVTDGKFTMPSSNVTITAT